MPRTRRPRTRGKARNVRSSSPAPSNASAAVSTPPSGRRSAAAASASTSKVSGRTTQNSRGNRGRRGGHGSARKNTGLGRNGSNRGRGRLAKKDSTLHQDPSSYKDEDGEVYKIGGKDCVLKNSLLLVY